MRKKPENDLEFAAVVERSLADVPLDAGERRELAETGIDVQRLSNRVSGLLDVMAGTPTGRRGRRRSGSAPRSPSEHAYASDGEARRLRGGAAATSNHRSGKDERGGEVDQTNGDEE